MYRNNRFAILKKLVDKTRMIQVETGSRSLLWEYARMKGSGVQKIGRLLGHLASHPSNIPRYLRLSLLNKSMPLDSGIPWISFAAIDFLEGYLKPHMHVFEYGSGGSTLFFAKRVADVVSVEDKKEWHDTVQARLASKEIRNVSLMLTPLDARSDGESLLQSEYVNALPNRSFDVYMIDGQDGPRHQVRPVCFRHIEERIQPGAIIVVDDSWRYEGLRTANRAKKWEAFAGVGPCRPGVTSTDVYFY